MTRTMFFLATLAILAGCGNRKSPEEVAKVMRTQGDLCEKHGIDRSECWTAARYGYEPCSWSGRPAFCKTAANGDETWFHPHVDPILGAVYIAGPIPAGEAIHMY